MNWLVSKLLSWPLRRTGDRGQPTVSAEARDPLTQLMSRTAFLARFRESLRSGQEGAVALLDLDHFKRLNNDLGHEAGDRVLVEVAARLRAAVSADVGLARLGGDEFGLFMPGHMGPACARLEQVLEALRVPIDLESRVQINASVGVAPLSKSGDLDKTLSWAEAALVSAKCSGRHQVVAFSGATDAFAKERRNLAKTVDLLQARNRELQGQVQFDALTGLRSRQAWDEFSRMTCVGGQDAGSHCAVAFLDIDHFGSINKHLGDASGDDTLRQVAALIQAAARCEDLVFRKGGDEIIVVLPGARAEEAVMAAERIRAAVEAAALVTADTSTAPVITVTLGVAASSDDSPCRVDELMNRASEAAMRAKVQAQRNRVHLA